MIEGVQTMPIDKATSALAANTYANALNTAKGAGVTSSDKVSFGDLVETAAKDSIDTLKEGEKMSANAVTGNATLTDVVEAVTAAELTLQTVVAVRDRMLSAYQEIMRMPI
jgi:flagellar hook-basal body complex protein FliE